MPDTPARIIALGQSTTPELSPPEMVSVAARTGYTHVGFRLLPSAPDGFAWPLMTDETLLRETLTRLQGTGVRVLDIDVIRLQADTKIAALWPLLETAQRLGASAVATVVDDINLPRVATNIAKLCDMAANCRLTVEVAFVPWTNIPNLEAANFLLHGIARPNAGILIDAIHLYRSASSVKQVMSVNTRWLHYMRLCDAPAEKPYDIMAIIHSARHERMFPGEGGLDLLDLLRAMPDMIPISVTVPTATLAQTVGPEERAARALAATRAVLAKVGATRRTEAPLD